METNRSVYELALQLLDRAIELPEGADRTELLKQAAVLFRDCAKLPLAPGKRRA